MKVKYLPGFGLFFSPHFVHYHEKRNYPGLPRCIIGGALAFWGCDKMPQSEHSPQAAQPVTQKVVTEVLTPKQAAWKLFVEQVERGERIDPLG